MMSWHTHHITQTIDMIVYIRVCMCVQSCARVCVFIRVCAMYVCVLGCYWSYLHVHYYSSNVSVPTPPYLQNALHRILYTSRYVSHAKYTKQSWRLWKPINHVIVRYIFLTTVKVKVCEKTSRHYDINSQLFDISSLSGLIWFYWMFYDHFSARSLLAKLGRWGWWWAWWRWLERKARRH